MLAAIMAPLRPKCYSLGNISLRQLPARAGCMPETPCRYAAFHEARNARRHIDMRSICRAIIGHLLFIYARVAGQLITGICHLSAHIATSTHRVDMPEKTNARGQLHLRLLHTMALVYAPCHNARIIEKSPYRPA